MKKNILIFLALCSLGFGTSAFASSQTNSIDEKTWNVRVNPLGFLLGTLSGDVAFAATQKFSIGPTFSYFSATSNLLGTSVTGVGLGVRANYYLTGNATEGGFLVGPTVGWSNLGIRYQSSQASANGFYLGAIGGYQWIWKSGFNLSLGLGANYYTQSDTAVASDGTLVAVPSFTGLAPTAEVSLGIAI